LFPNVRSLRNYVASEFYNNCVVNYIRSNIVIAEHLRQCHYYKLVYQPLLLQFHIIPRLIVLHTTISLFLASKIKLVWLYELLTFIY